MTVNNGKAILSYYESQDPNEAHLVQYVARNIKTPDGEHVYVNVDLPVVSAVTYRDFKDGTEQVCCQQLQGARPVFISIVVPCAMTHSIPGSRLLRR